MAIRIRPAEPRDIPAIAELALALARMHVEIDHQRFVAPEGGVRAFVEFFSGELERPAAVLLIAEDGSTPVGYAFVRMEPASIEALIAPSAWLHDVYVGPTYRGRGIGRQLFDAAIESARKLGSSSLMLGVSPANTQARRLYERAGMRTTLIEMRVDLA